MNTKSLRLALMVFCIAGSAWAADMTQQTAAGKVLVDPSGMTLYTFDKDSPGMSACVAACTALWPPYLADANSMAHGDWALVTRDDGAKQWSYKGKPLYKWSKDMKAGDSMGDGFKGLWHVAIP